LKKPNPSPLIPFRREELPLADAVYRPEGAMAKTIALEDMGREIIIISEDGQIILIDIEMNLILKTLLLTMLLPTLIDTIVSNPTGGQ
jgi:hypothetical protein